MSESKITVNDVVDSAIVEGFKNVSAMYIESLEETLRRNVLISEAGDAQALLQEMIDATETTQVQQESVEQLNELENKMARILKKE